MAILTKSEVHIEDFSTKNPMFLWKLVAFDLFSGDKGDCIDVWMIKTMIKTNQIDMEVCLFPK